jgi:hypothetical protein
MWRAQMNTTNRSIVVFALMSVCSVQHVSGFAQTNRDDERDERLSSQSAVRVYVAAESAAFDNVEPAPNITVSSVYQPVVEKMLARSATFRRQYARIAGAPHLSVVIRSQPVMGSRLPALTSIRRTAQNRVEAVVSIAACARITELIAHELEHIIEQLDGVDLPVKARLRASGVRRVNDQSFSAFETNRAIAAGLRVAREVLETPSAHWARTAK